MAEKGVEEQVLAMEHLPVSRPEALPTMEAVFLSDH